MADLKKSRVNALERHPGLAPAVSHLERLLLEFWATEKKRIAQQIQEAYAKEAKAASEGRPDS